MVKVITYSAAHSSSTAAILQSRARTHTFSHKPQLVADPDECTGKIFMGITFSLVYSMSDSNESNNALFSSVLTASTVPKVSKVLIPNQHKNR